MRMTKEEFVNAINNLQDFMQTMDAISRTMGTPLVESLLNEPVIKYFDFISQMCDIPKEVQDNSLTYFVYDLDFGKKYKPGCVTEGDGTICPLSTPEELYNDLVKSWQTPFHDGNMPTDQPYINQEEEELF